MELRGKVALVTGASSGIGKAIAIALARKHVHVLVHYGKNETGGRETLEQVEKFSSGSLYQSDLMDREQIISLFETIKTPTRTIDILVNNAGDAQPGDISDDRVWEYEYKNIFLSAMNVTRQFLSMPSSQLRKIVNIGSLYGNPHTGNPQYLQYSALKAALANVAATLNKSTAPQVVVNAIAPGYTLTPAWAGASKEALEAHARATLIGRFVAPEEIAHAVIFVAENDALVGQVLTIDGGTSLKGTV